VNTVGEALRTAREARQLTVEDVRGALGIPAHYIEALESGTARMIADEYYLIPFLRRYADYLELDGPMAVARFLSEASRGEAAASRGFSTLREPRWVPRWMWGAVAVGVAAALAAAVWLSSGS
jgi:cytoskeleton protein RodZ